MKTFRSLALLCSLAGTAVMASVPTLETEKELLAVADVDGDGFQDLVVANKRAGSLRAAFGSAGASTHLGPVTVAPFLKEGTDLIAGLSLARFFGPVPGAAVLAAPAGGQLRAVALDKSSPAAFGKTAVSSVGIQTLGPSKVVALPIGVAGAHATLDGVVVATSLNASPSPGALETVKITGPGLLSSHGNSTISGSRLVVGANPVFFDRAPGARPYVGLLIGAPFDPPQLQIHNVATAAPNPDAPSASANIPASGYTQIASGQFGASLLPQVLVWGAGQQMVYAYPLTPGNPPTLAAPAFRNFPTPVATLAVVRGQGAQPDRLLVTFSYGETRAALYDYDGVNFPVQVQAFAAPNGGDFAGGVAAENGEFFLMEKDPATGGSRGFSRYGYNGNLIATENFPVKPSFAGRGNVIYYSATPLANPRARVVSILHSGDWAGGTPTTAPLPSPVTASSETFLGEAAGLGSATPVSLGAPPAGALGVLGNQFAGDISAFNLGGSLGGVTDTVAIDPPPGAYRSAITLEISSAVNAESPGTRTVFFRIDPQGAWQTYNPVNPPQLAYDATVYAYSQASAGGARSDIVSSRYTFDGSGSLDSDKDGIPDHVELGSGLDPTAGVDSDGDGDSDLTELYAGTDPADPNSNLGRRDAGSRTGGVDSVFSSFDLSVHVWTRFKNGAVGVDARPDNDVAVSAQTLDGGLLAEGRTYVQVDYTAARLTGITPDAAIPYFSISSAANFPLLGYPGNGGREVAGLVRAQEPSHTLPSDYYNGWQTTTEAAAGWVSMLRAELLPTSGNFTLTRGSESSAIPFNATSAQVKAALDAMNGGTGIFGGGVSGVSGTVPRFSVLALAPPGHSGSQISVTDALPTSEVIVIPRSDSLPASQFVQFDILMVPSAPIRVANISVTETLLALLVEKKLGALLGVATPTIFPLRPSDSGRNPVTSESIALMEVGKHPGTPAYLLDGLVEPMRALLEADPPSSDMQALKNVANYLYEFSSVQTGPGPIPAPEVIAGFRDGSLTPANTPAAMAAPFDALRAFLADGNIGSSYTGQPTLVTKNSAMAAVAACMAAAEPRPVFSGILLVGAGGFLSLDGISNGVSYLLFDSTGAPYSFDASIPLQPGTRLAVTGYNDIDAGGNPHMVALEVLSVTLLSLPNSNGVDSDGNLLADDWEEAFYGSIGQNSFSLGAGGKSLVQLYLDRDDPTLGSAEPVAELFPHHVHLIPEGIGSYTMAWKFPAKYAPYFYYTLQTTDSLANPFADISAAGGLSASGEDHSLPLGPPSNPSRQFWRLKLKLKR